MKNLVLAAAAASALVSAPVATLANTQTWFSDNARVIASRPVVERIPVTREECWNDRVRGYEERRVTRTDTGAEIGAGTVLGAVIGGAVGRQFGDSNRGKNQGTVAGAVVGGLIGNQVDRANGAEPHASPGYEVERVPVERDVKRCREVREVREATVGYDVRYEYQGREFTTRLPTDPGRRLRVKVALEPDVVAERREDRRERHEEPPRGNPAPPAYTR